MLALEREEFDVQVSLFVKGSADWTLLSLQHGLDAVPRYALRRSPVLVQRLHRGKEAAIVWDNESDDDERVPISCGNNTDDEAPLCLTLLMVYSPLYRSPEFFFCRSGAEGCLRDFLPSCSAECDGRGLIVSEGFSEELLQPAWSIHNCDLAALVSLAATVGSEARRPVSKDDVVRLCVEAMEGALFSGIKHS